jgi:hypothetical protein
MGRGQLAQRFDGDGELSTRALLVPHPTDHPVDQHHRVVAGLARRSEPAVRRRAWVQPLPRLTRDDERVEVGQQADPSVRLLRRPVSPAITQPDSPSSTTRSSSSASASYSSTARRGGMLSHLAKCWGRGWAVGVQVARDKRAQGRVAVVRPEAGQPAVRVCVGHFAAPVWSEAEHAAVSGRAR